MENQPSNPGEALWRRKLSEAGRNALRAQPELELEARLTAALGQIPDAPVPSNFTARVLTALELEAARTERSHGWTLHWRLLWPRVAVVAAVLIFAGVGLQRHETNSHRRALVKNVAMVTVAQPPPSVDALENLDAIQRMSQPARADGELLAALQ
jgi:negative regulator of sigma E activity